MAVYRTERKVLFQHCDPAGMVFYPRYFEMINSVIEEWFESAIGVSFADMVLRRGEGVPTAKIEAEFLRPSRLGDDLGFTLSLTKLGGASAHIYQCVRSHEEIRVICRSVLVRVDSATARASVWPKLMRARMSEFLEATE